MNHEAHTINMRILRFCIKDYFRKYMRVIQYINCNQYLLLTNSTYKILSIPSQGWACIRSISHIVSGLAHCGIYGSDQYNTCILGAYFSSSSSIESPARQQTVLSRNLVDSSKCLVSDELFPLYSRRAQNIFRQKHLWFGLGGLFSLLFQFPQQFYCKANT
jgi:hypothetical protein